MVGAQLGEEAPKEALQKAFLQLDAEWLSLAAKGNYDDGSTAIVAVVQGNVLTVSNLGDSRCVLSSGGRAVDMSHDHKPIREDEKQRILDLGGRVIHYGTWRVEGILAVSRAFGDRRLKKFVTADPEIKSRELQEQDDFLILASDGVWDVLSSQAAVDIVSKASTPQQAAAYLTDAAYSRGSLDNITSLVVDLRYFIRH
jgi:protein phosphatase 1L